MKCYFRVSACEVVMSGCVRFHVVDVWLSLTAVSVHACVFVASLLCVSVVHGWVVCACVWCTFFCLWTFIQGEREGERRCVVSCARVCPHTSWMPQTLQHKQSLLLWSSHRKCSMCTLRFPFCRLLFTSMGMEALWTVKLYCWLRRHYYIVTIITSVWACPLVFLAGIWWNGGMQ